MPVSQPRPHAFLSENCKALGRRLPIGSKEGKSREFRKSHFWKIRVLSSLLLQRTNLRKLNSRLTQIGHWQPICWLRLKMLKTYEKRLVSWISGQDCEKRLKWPFCKGYRKARWCKVSYFMAELRTAKNIRRLHYNHIIVVLDKRKKKWLEEIPNIRKMTRSV